MKWEDIREVICGPPAKGDKPRKIVVCSKADYPRIQEAVTDLGYGDVLVKPSRFVDDGDAYVMNPPPEIITGPGWFSGGSSR